MPQQPSGARPDRRDGRRRADACATGSRAIQARARGDARRSRAEVERGGRRAAAAPAAARPRPHRPAVRDHRPAGVDGPRPGAAPRARRRRLRRALRDRRRRGVRRRPATRSTSRRTGAARRCTAPTPRSRCTRRCSPRTPPRCCPTRCARRCCGRSRSTRPARAPTSRSSGPGCGRPRKLDYDGRPAGDRRRHRAARRCSCSREVGELRLAARGRPRRRLAAAARAGGRRRRRHVALEFRSLLPVEEWNAQISLLTGFARRLADGLRPGRAAADPAAAGPARRPAAAPHRPGAATSTGRPSSSTPTSSAPSTRRRPDHAAMVTACTRLLRGSGYVGFDGEVPADPQHAALASEYAHVTAPLRRLGDRYAGEICVALCAGTEVPGWVLEKLARAARRRCRTPAAGPTSTRARDPRPGRGRRAAAPGGGDLRGASWWTIDDQRRARAATSPSRSPPSRRRVTGAGDRCRSAPTCAVRLTAADVASRSVTFVLDAG